jgi:leader peptidase (prepilin peptidase)/N-methyltransferase
VSGLFLLLIKKKGRKDALPFGPFLALGALLSLLWGHEIVHLYLRV